MRFHLASRNLPGPIDGSGSTLRCISHYFTKMGASPFTSYQEMSSWFRKYCLTLRLNNHSSSDITQEHSEKPYSFDSSIPLALTHGDININNIRLGPDGALWLWIGNVPGLPWMVWILFRLGAVVRSHWTNGSGRHEGHEDVEELGRNEEGSLWDEWSWGAIR